MAASFWDQLAQEISMNLARRLPPANLHRIFKSLRDLHAVVEHLTKEKLDMTNPTDPTDLRSISQSVLDGIGNAVESAATALKGVIANGNLQPADLTIVNQAVTDLDALEVPVTPPAPVDPTPAPDAPTS